MKTEIFLRWDLCVLGDFRDGWLFDAMDGYNGQPDENEVFVLLIGA